MRPASLLGVSAFSLACVIASCGGASETDLFQGGASSSTSSASSSGGASSSGASTSSSSTSSSTSSSGASGDVDAGPKPCKRASPTACAPNELCKVMGCGEAGVCVPRPAPTDVYAPVCGCDGVTYWNETIANAAGISARSSSPCPPNAPSTARCGGLDNVLCEGFRRCNYQVSDVVACALPLPRSGTCWGLPEDCPKAVETIRRCGSGGCKTLCEAIDAQEGFYVDATCP